VILEPSLPKFRQGLCLGVVSILKTQSENRSRKQSSKWFSFGKLPDFCLTSALVQTSTFSNPKRKPILTQDQQLITRLHACDPVAIGELYDAYGGALFGVVLRIVQQRDLAEQVLHDTFVKAWRNGARYDASKGRLFTWLLNIARNTAIDATRTAHFQKSRKTDSLDSLVHNPGGEQINADQIGLREIVEQMDEKYRLLIDLVYFQGFTQEEAAEKTGIPLGTIKTRMRYAMQELRRVFVSILMIWLLT